MRRNRRFGFVKPMGKRKPTTAESRAKQKKKTLSHTLKCFSGEGKCFGSNEGSPAFEPFRAANTIRRTRGAFFFSRLGGKTPQKPPTQLHDEARIGLERGGMALGRRMKNRQLKRGYLWPMIHLDDNVVVVAITVGCRVGTGTTSKGA